MPVQVSQSVLADFDAATQNEVSAHAHDPLRTGLSDLPPGITGGVARLVKLRFEKIGPDSTRKKADGSSASGEAQLVIAGVVMEPSEIVHPKTGQVIRVAGQQFRPIPIPICDMKRGDKVASRSEQALRAMDDMKLIADNERLFPAVVTAQVLEQTALALENRSQTNPIYFRFSTEGSDDGSMTFQNVRKAYGLEAYAPPSANGKVHDNPALRAQAQTNFSAAPGAATQVQQSAAQTQVAVDPLAAPIQPTVEQLVTLSSGDERLKEVRNAQLQLMQVWKASGRSEQSFKEAPTYQDIGKILAQGPVQAPMATPAASAQPIGPKKDDVWKVKIAYTDPLGDQQTMLVESVITAVNDDGTYDLTDMKTKTKVFSKIQKDALVAV